MANVSNALSGYWAEQESWDTTTWKIAWTVTQNANFTWTVNVKFYINTHNTMWYEEFKPRIKINGITTEGTWAVYGGSTSDVQVLEGTTVVNCSETGSAAIVLQGIHVGEEESASNKVWGYLTLPSFSGSYVKINSNTWKHAMAWIKINGQWKRCRQYVKVNGAWKLADYKWLYNP